MGYSTICSGVGDSGQEENGVGMLNPMNCTTTDPIYWEGDTICIDPVEEPDDENNPICGGICPVDGCNPFNVYDGNVYRAVADMEVAGGARGNLTWARHHNSVPRWRTPRIFGLAGDWRHNWQYELIEFVKSGAPVEYRLIKPDGNYRLFHPASSGGFAPESRFAEAFAVTTDGCEITFKSGAKARFVRTTMGERSRLDLVALTDAHGLVTGLENDAQGRLTRVTEPAGRSLTIAYKDVAFQSGRWRELAAVKTAPAPGQWLEFAVPTVLQSTPFQHLRLLSGTGGTLAVAEVQVFAPHSGTALTGAAKGTGLAPQSAFDGDPATVFRGDRAAVNLCSLALESAQPLNRVRILPAPGRENELVGATLAGLLRVPDVVTVIDRVAGSDGRFVSYDYQLSSDPFTAHEHVGLVAARYGDGTQARYRYAYVTASQQPLLIEADEGVVVGERFTHAHDDDVVEGGEFLAGAGRAGEESQGVKP